MTRAFRVLIVGENSNFEGHPPKRNNQHTDNLRDYRLLYLLNFRICLLQNMFTLQLNMAYIP